MSLDLVSYLRRRGLLADEDVAAGDIRVDPEWRRNENYRVTSAAGTFFVKRGGEARTLANEAAAYALLTTGAAAPRAFLPRYYGYDDAEQILVLELIPGAENLVDYHRRLRRFPKAVAKQLGNTLADLHQTNSPGPSSTGMAAMPPAALSIHQPRVANLRMLSPGHLQLLKGVQGEPAFARLFDDLRADWRGSCIIHGDLRWDNCVRSHVHGRGLVVVDWELWGLGEPAWDVASVIANYLQFWVGSMPLGQRLPSQDLAKLAGLPLRQMLPAIDSFWRAYCSQRKLEAGEAAVLLLESARFLVARLIELAYDGLHSAPGITAEADILVNLALNVMRRPEETLVQLLGLSLPSEVRP